MRSIHLYFLLALITTNGSAGEMQEVEIAGQPNMIVLPDGSIGLCGMRFLFVKKIVEGRDATVSNLIDASLNMNADGGVLVKGLALAVTTRTSGYKDSVKRPLSAIWVKSQGGKATTPRLFLDSEDEISVLYLDAKFIERYSELVRSIAENNPVMIGVKTAANDDTTVFVGKVRLSEVERNAFLNCSVELIEIVGVKLQNRLQQK